METPTENKHSVTVEGSGSSTVYNMPRGAGKTCLRMIKVGYFPPDIKGSDYVRQ